MNYSNSANWTARGEMDEKQLTFSPDGSQIGPFIIALWFILWTEVIYAIVVLNL